MRTCRLTIILLALALILNSCKKRCESNQIGSANLNESSKLFLPYMEGEELIFQNELNEELKFTNKRIEETVRSCINFKCEGISDPFVGPPCDYYHTEALRNILQSEDNTMIIDMSISMEIYEEESTLFYDIFNINWSAIGNLSSGTHVSFVHFDVPQFDISKISFNPILTKVDEIELNGQTYNEVFYTTLADNMIYLTQNDGIIALRKDQEVWMKIN